MLHTSAAQPAHQAAYTRWLLILLALLHLLLVRIELLALLVRVELLPLLHLLHPLHVLPLLKRSHFSLQVLELLVHRRFAHVLIHLTAQVLRLCLIPLKLGVLHVRRLLGLEGVLHWLAKLPAKGLLPQLRPVLHVAKRLRHHRVVRLLAKIVSVLLVFRFSFAGLERHRLTQLRRLVVVVNRQRLLRLLPRSPKISAKSAMSASGLVLPTKPTARILLRRAKRVVGKARHLPCPASRRGALPLLRTQRV